MKVLPTPRSYAATGASLPIPRLYSQPSRLALDSQLSMEPKHEQERVGALLFV